MHRKFISPCLLASFLISLIFISGCGDNSTSPSSGGFSFKLTVVDQDGAPISGLKLSRRCSIEYDAPTSEMNQARMQILTETSVWPTASLQSGIGPAIVTKSVPGADPPTEFAIHPAIPNPGTTISIITIDVPVICNLGIKVLDWLGKEIQDHTLTVPATSVSMGYRFIDEGDNPLPNGIYRVIFTATGGASTVLFTDAIYFSGYTDRDPFRQLMGQTNTHGSFFTTDKGYFPSLQGHQPQMSYNIDRVEEGLFSFSNVVEIKVLSEPLPGAGSYVYWMTREVVISDGSNDIEWVFVPDDSVAVQ